MKQNDTDEVLVLTHNSIFSSGNTENFLKEEYMSGE